MKLLEELGKPAAYYAVHGEIIVLYRGIILSNNSHCSSPILLHVTAGSLSLCAIPVPRESGSTLFLIFAVNVMSSLSLSLSLSLI